MGLRGVGKTVLLDRLRLDAQKSNLRCLRIEAPEGRSLPAILAPQLRLELHDLSREPKATELARRALRGLAGFAKALKVKHGDLEVGLDLDREPGLADKGDLEHDLQALLQVIGMAAKSAETAVSHFTDELQSVPEQDLAALITALQGVAQTQLPVCLVGAGLPQLPGKMGRAKSYAERLFDFTEIGALSPDAAKQALLKPLEEQSVTITDEALELIYQHTLGYPYFFQEWGNQVWDVAVSPHIDREVVVAANRLAVATLDESFFRVRFDRLTPLEKRYLRAMAELGPGPHRSGDIAAVMNRKVNSLAPTRNQLVAKGMIYSPIHGDTAFTVPLFDTFMRRILPGDEWRS